jgi:hypothetical protein
MKLILITLAILLIVSGYVLLMYGVSYDSRERYFHVYAEHRDGWCQTTIKVNGYPSKQSLKEYMREDAINFAVISINEINKSDYKSYFKSLKKEK